MEKSISSKAYAKFVQKLREARSSAGMTQVEVAKLLKQPQQWVSKIESGQRRVDVVELQALAKLYKKPLTYFGD